MRYGLRVPGRDVIDTYENTRAAGFGKEVRRRILIGTYVLSAGYYDAYYLKAQKVRTLIKRDFDEAWNKVDVVLTPTTPSPAFAFGEKSGDPLAMYLEDIFTVTVNMAGLPGMSVPAGLSSEGTPLGLQLIGKPFDEATLFRVGQAIEDAAGRFTVPERWWTGARDRGQAAGPRKSREANDGPEAPLGMRRHEPSARRDRPHRRRRSSISSSERFGYVERAWQLKKNPSDAHVPWRIQQVIDKVKARAAERGMPPEMIEMVSAQWRNMIGWFVQYEEEKLRKQSEAGGTESK